MRFVFDEEKQQMMEVIGPVDRNDLVLNVQRANDDIEEYDRVFDLQTKPAEPDAPADPAAEADKAPADEVQAKAAEATPPAVPAPGTEAAAPANPAAKDEFGDEKPDDTKEFE